MLQIFKTIEKSEFHVLIKHCFLMEKKYCSSKAMAFDKCYLNSAPSETMVKMWYTDFNRGGINTNDAECSGCPNSAVVVENTKKLHKLILLDRKLKLREIAEELKISEGSVFTILHEHLSMRKLCSKWVSCLLTVDQKQCINVVCSCFNTTKKRFCINMLQWMKYGSTTSLWSQIGSQLSGQ